MKTKALLMFCIILIAGCISILYSCKREAPKVLLYIRDGSGVDRLEFMLIKEVGTMREIIEQSGFKVIIATVTGEEIKTDSTTLTPDIRSSEVQVDDYEGFIFPCMASDSMPTREAIALVKKVVEKDKPIAAQLGAVLILGEAGVLNGKKYAFSQNAIDNPDMYPVLKGGIFSGIGVIQDGNIFTSGTCPMMAKMTGNKDGTAELTQKLIQEIKTRTK